MWKFNSKDSIKLKIWFLVLSIMFFSTICIEIPIKFTLEIFERRISADYIPISLWLFIKELIPGASALRASSRLGIIILLFTGPFIIHSSSYWQKIKIDILKFVFSVSLIFLSLLSSLKQKLFEI